MKAAELYQQLGVTPIELLSGESVNNYTSRVLGHQVQTSNKTAVRYSYGTATSKTDKNVNHSKGLYTY